MARIEWSPDGTRFVTRLPDDRIRMHRADGTEIRPIGRALDARWDGSDRVISIDRRGDLRWHGAIGVESYATIIVDAHAAWFAPGGRAVATLSSRHLACHRFGGREATWTLDTKRHGLPDPDQLTCALSYDGTRIAIGYRTLDGRMHGRGFVVIELASDREIERDFVVIEGGLAAPIAFAFDRGGGRLAIMHPERFPALGVVQLGAGTELIRAHLGGARAIALDERGMIAAYAWAGSPPNSGARLVFEFLAPETRGGTVPVDSELAFDVVIPDVIAIGFDPDSRWLACLASNGAIEIVPVP